MPVIKRLVFGCVLALTVLYVAMSASTYFADTKACLGAGYYVQLNTPTFHTLHGNNDVLLRGTIAKVHSDKGMIFGYLSLANVSADSLTDVLSQNDKEGYFVIDTKTQSMMTGLEFSDVGKIASQHGVQIGSADAFTKTKFNSHSCKD